MWSGERFIAIHPPMVSRSTKSEVFETGIKLIDVLVPLERGGQGGIVRRRRRWEDGAVDRNYSQHGFSPEGSESFLRNRRTLS